MSGIAYTCIHESTSRGSLKIYTLVRYRLLVLLSVLVFVSCKRDIGPDTSQLFCYNEANGISSLDPALASYQAAGWAGTQLFNSLVDLDTALVPQPCLAQSWEIADSGCTWTFHLRTDVSFHTDPCFGSRGTRRMKAEDVRYSIERIIHAKSKSPGLWVFRRRIVGADDFYRASQQGQEKHCSGIKVLDDSTLQFRLVSAYAPFLQLLCMPYAWVVPREAIEFYGQDFGRHPVGTGPFCFDHWTTDVELLLKKNTTYFRFDSAGQRLPYVQGVRISFIKDSKTEFLEFRSGNVDVLSSIDPSIAPAVVDEGGTLREAFRQYQIQQACAQSVEYYGILLDTTIGAGHQSMLARSRYLRQALNYAIDRERIVRYVLNGKGKAATHGVLPPGLPGFDESTRGYDYDPERARQLLAKAGFPAGKGLPVLTLQMGNSARTVSVAEAIQQMWKEIGVQLEIKQVDFPQHLEMVSSSKLQLWRTSWIGDYPDPENFLALFYSGFHSPNGPNTTHYKSTVADSLYTLALSPLLSSEQRFALYRQMERMIIEESPWIFLYYSRIERLLQPSIHGLSLDGADRLVLETVRKSTTGR